MSNSRLRVRWLSAGALGLLLATVGATWWLMARERVDEGWVAHTEAVLHHLDALLADVIDGETAERGFVISGESSFLAPYEAARVRCAHDLARLRTLTRDNRAQQRRLHRVEQVANAELAAFGRVIALRRQDVPAAMAAVAAGGDKQLTDEVRRVLGEMKSEELTLLARRQRAAAASERDAVLVVFAAYAGLLVALGCAAWALQLSAQRSLLAEREAARLEATVELARARRERDDFRERFLAIVGHDLRTPLTAISVEAQLLREHEDPEERAAAGTRIVGATQRMLRMVEQLLDATRSRLGGGMPIRARERDLRELVRRSLDELARLARGRLTLALPAVPVRGEFDDDRIAQVVGNLVGNALTHGEGEVTVSLRAGDGYAELAVHNYGEPIPREALAHLCEPFRRGSAESSGLGLGLFISDQIVRGHGGSMHFESCQERGTTACVRLPCSAGRVAGGAGSSTEPRCS